MNSGPGKGNAVPGNAETALPPSGPALARTLLVVGHDPALPGLARTLAEAPAARAGSEEQAAADRMRAKFPTAAVAAFVFRGGWDQLAPGAARLACFVTPRQLEAPGDRGDGSTHVRA